MANYSEGTNLVDLDKYPIHDLSSKAGRAFVARCRQNFEQDGSLLLEGFVRPDYIGQMAEEVMNLPAHRRLEIVQVFRRDPWTDKQIFESELPDSHAALFRMPQDVHAVACDVVPMQSLLRKLYDSKEVMDFIAAVNNRQEIFQFADEFQALNVMYMKDGGSRAWHYDGTDFVVTLMLQPSTYGGEFEYAPFIRGENIGDERYGDVANLFRGTWRTKKTRCNAGALSILNGRNAMNCVWRESACDECSFLH